MVQMVKRFLCLNQVQSTIFSRKTGLYYPSDEQDRVEVEQWLMWQMGGFGPMLAKSSFW
jgi:hypothetical protein